MAKATPDRPSSGDVQDLAIAVEQLTEETRLLRMSLDELRDDVVWAARQVLAAGYQATGTPQPPPRDPLAPDMAIPTIDNATNADPESVEDSHYCCDCPKLEWNGDPDVPGVACANCGYVIAELGSVVIWRGDTDDSSDAQHHSKSQAPEPQGKQGELF